jgi:hypothetical protein
MSGAPPTSAPGQLTPKLHEVVETANISTPCIYELMFTPVSRKKMLTANRLCCVAMAVDVPA